MEEDLVYFESAWSILSSVCLVCVLLTASLMSAYGCNNLLMVPLVVSAMGALADGLCWYAYYAPDYPLEGQKVAAAVADIAWGIQEIGLSFYTYQLLNKLLSGKSRKDYLGMFWGGVAIGAAMRMAILILRQLGFNGASVQDMVNNCHLAYFLSIAFIETINCWFLMSKLKAEMESSMFDSEITFSVLLKSSEYRLATLGIIGVARAITYSFQKSAQAASNTASQLDRFVVILECLYPYVILVDYVITRSSRDRGAIAVIASNACPLADRSKTAWAVNVNQTNNTPGTNIGLPDASDTTQQKVSRPSVARSNQ